MGDHRGAVEDMDSADLIQCLTPNERSDRAHYVRMMYISDVDVAADAEASHCAATHAATSVVSYGVNSANLATTPAADSSDSTAASALYSHAHRKRVDGELQGALAVLDQAAQLQPKDSKIFLERASIKMEAADYLGALQDLDVYLSQWMQRVISSCNGKLPQSRQYSPHFEARGPCSYLCLAYIACKWC